MKATMKFASLFTAALAVFVFTTTAMAEVLMIEMEDGELYKIPMEGVREIYMTTDGGQRISGVLPPEDYLKDAVKDYYEKCSWFLRGNSFATSGNIVRVDDVTITGVTVGASKVNIMIEAEVIGRDGFPSSRALGARFTFGDELVFEQGAEGWRITTPRPRGDINCDIVGARRF